MQNAADRPQLYVHLHFPIQTYTQYVFHKHLLDERQHPLDNIAGRNQEDWCMFVVTGR